VPGREVLRRLTKKFLRAVADYDPDYYDMYADPSEACFAQLYIEQIARHAADAGIRPPARVLEAGCQAGRLVIPLAKLGFEVTGIDTSRFAIRRAQAHARKAGVKATFTHADLQGFLHQRHTPSYDIVTCAEVLYLSPQYRTLLQTLAHAVRPGGLLCVSHRPKWYYLLEALRTGDVATAAHILHDSEGAFRDSTYYNWQNEEELHRLYASLGLPRIAIEPIDRLAWLSHLSLAQLTPAQQAQWLALERQLPYAVGQWARYLLVIATVPTAAHPPRTSAQAAHDPEPAMIATFPSDT
jgi:2-polyprenyl-3-methyl-5-hydroxy-6-metoxy-1,4-benzoquinol methylase